MRTEEEAREIASNAYHDHPSNPSDCEAYKEHATWRGQTNAKCPCENDWRDFLPTKIKFTKPQLRMLAMARNSENNFENFLVPAHGPSIRVAERLRKRGCLIQKGLSYAYGLTAMGRYVADEQGWRPGGRYHRRTFTKEELEAIR